MMTPESITVSLEWAQRLKEAGWVQDVCFYWIKHASSPKPFVVYLPNLQQRDPDTLEIWFHAPTAEEILRRLPKSLATKDRTIHRLSINCNGGKRWRIFYGTDVLFDSPVAVDANESLANAAAQMWIYLKTNHLLPPQV